MKTIAIAAVTAILLCPNVTGQTNNPPAPASAPAPAAAPAAAKKADAPATDEGIRKLSRRERKDRIQKLGDKYRQFLAEVEPIMLPEELDTFLLLETDPQRDVYIDDFWRRRDQAQGTTNRAFHDEYYERIEIAKEKFKNLSSDRSKMFLIHGAPDEVFAPNCNEILVPIEIWKYGYVPGLGHDQVFIFYRPRREGDYRLWLPVMDQQTALAELVGEQAEAFAPGGDGTGAVGKVFYQPIQPGTNINEVQYTCQNGDDVWRSINIVLNKQTDLLKVFNPPPANEENVHRILHSVVIANPVAARLPAEVKFAYPAKQGSRTDMQLTVLVPRDKATKKEVSGSTTYSFDVTGEVVKNDQMFESFRYRFDFPGDIKDEKLPLIVDRFLRPSSYKTRLRITDVHSGAEAILENNVEVPELLETADTRQKKEDASAKVATIKDAIESNDTSLRIVPFSDEEIIAGLQHVETVTTGDDIKGVEFYLDGRKVMVKRQPPYTLDVDFGAVPRARRIRAVAVDDKGQVLTGDEIVVNTGTDPFRVRIVSPRVAVNLHGAVRVQLSVKVPDGKTLDDVKLFYNETPVATLYGPPWVQTVNVPSTEGVAYLRAVASLKDDPTPPVEDVVMVNTPQFMEEVNVHLIELPTTVIANGHPVNTLSQSAFRILDEGKPVKITKFEQVKNLSLSIGMAIDTSGSMEPRMAEAQKAGANFFKSVMKPGDKAFLVAFDTQPQMVQKWSSRVADVNAGLSKLRAEETTALYDAIVYSLYNFVGVRGQKALVVITDGRDTASKFSFDQAVEYARRTAVPIYAIAIGMSPTDIDVKFKLARFCSETGGNLYTIENAAQLGAIYDQIQNELRSQYILGFYPPEGTDSGSSKWHELTVQVSEGRAKTIHGYYP